VSEGREELARWQAALLTGLADGDDPDAVRARVAAAAPGYAAELARAEDRCLEVAGELVGKWSVPEG